jgi:hypothetical protein
MLARSRLKRNLEEPLAVLPEVFRKERGSSAVGFTLKNKYSKHAPLLIFAVISYCSVGYILSAIPPGQIANVPLPLAYAPLHIPLFLGNVFFFSFIFLHTRRGLLLALFVLSITFLKLQLFVLTPVLILGIFIVLLLSEVLLNLLHSKRK